MKTLWPVLRSYVTGWQFWLVLGLWLCQFVPFASMASRQRGCLVVPFLVFAVVYAAAGVAVRTKEHLGAYRAALVPGYKRPHLLAAGLWLGLAVLPFPAVAALTGGSASGILALVLALTGLACAGCCRGGWRGGLLFGGCLLLWLPPLAEAVGALAAGAHPWAAVSLGLLGLWWLVETGLFLVTMDEETPGYDVQFRGNLRQLSGPQARRSMFAAVRRLDRTNSIWLRLADARIPATMPFVGDSRWRRLRHWRRAQASGWVSILMATATWVLMKAMNYGMHGYGSDLQSFYKGSVWVLVMMPQTLIMQTWQARGGMLGREFTYPVRRRDIVIEQGVTILGSVLLSWLVLMGAMALVPSLLAEPTPWRTLAIALLVSGPWQILVFALLARLATLRSGVPLVAAVALNVGCGTGLLLSCTRWNSIATAALVGGAIMVAALAGLLASYRHWLRVDLP